MDGGNKNMEIRKLFGRSVDKNEIGLNNKAEQVVAQKEVIKDIELENQEASAGEGEDVVRLSGLSKRLSQISELVDNDQISRSKRIVELKKAITDGKYSVSSQDVAKSLVDYARELPEQKEV